MKSIKNAFTLIEVIVGVSILSLMMVAIIAIFVQASHINNKVEISRIMQENLKHAIDTISEDIRVNDIYFSAANGHQIDNGNYHSSTERLHTGTFPTKQNEYYLITGDSAPYTIVGNYTDCTQPNVHCKLGKNNGSGAIPITNSWIRFENLSFHVSGASPHEPKVTIVFTAKPSYNKGIPSNLIQENTIDFQSTFSARQLHHLR